MNASSPLSANPSKYMLVQFPSKTGTFKMSVKHIDQSRLIHLFYPLQFALSHLECTCGKLERHKIEQKNKRGETVRFKSSSSIIGKEEQSFIVSCNPLSAYLHPINCLYHLKQSSKVKSLFPRYQPADPFVYLKQTRLLKKYFIEIGHVSLSELIDSLDDRLRARAGFFPNQFSMLEKTRKASVESLFDVQIRHLDKVFFFPKLADSKEEIALLISWANGALALGQSPLTGDDQMSKAVLEKTPLNFKDIFVFPQPCSKLLLDCYHVLQERDKSRNYKRRGGDVLIYEDNQQLRWAPLKKDLFSSGESREAKQIRKKAGLAIEWIIFLVNQALDENIQTVDVSVAPFPDGKDDPQKMDSTVLTLSTSELLETLLENSYCQELIEQNPVLRRPIVRFFWKIFQKQPILDAIKLKSFLSEHQEVLERLCQTLQKEQRKKFKSAAASKINVGTLTEDELEKLIDQLGLQNLLFFFNQAEKKRFLEDILEKERPLLAPTERGNVEIEEFFTLSRNILQNYLTAMGEFNDQFKHLIASSQERQYFDKHDYGAFFSRFFKPLNLPIFKIKDDIPSLLLSLGDQAIEAIRLKAKEEGLEQSPENFTQMRGELKQALQAPIKWHKLALLLADFLEQLRSTETSVLSL